MTKVSEEPDICVDVDRWARAKYWTWLEAEYLLVGLDPWKIEKIDPGVNLDLKNDKRRAARDALQFHFRTEDVPSKVSPTEALEVAYRARIEAPEALAEAVMAFAEDDAQKLDRLTSGESNKYNKLRKMLFAIAVVKFGYRPNADRQGAVYRGPVLRQRVALVRPPS
ncbi:hypothetical protein [Sediminimonas sp.]|uniref:hypothetical protein n=1 Tax=Sediminimonas sp. TaxID=2823379 RepID=UPI0025D8D2AD|nr:hypothetical protein [Sediminimonas sp.]